MNRTIRIAVTSLVISLFALSGIFAGAFDGKTVILHSNDVHGSIAGYANMAALRDEYEAEGADVILVDAGDFSQGSAYVSTSKGLDAVTMMNAVGYDIATLGNHEFDYGYAQLRENLSNAEFAVICANVFDSTGSTIYPSTAVIENDGVKIGFVGLETPEAQTKANPALIKGLYFAAENELYAVAEAAAASLNAQGVDLIIALSHLGVDAESAPNRSVDLYAETDGFDFIIDGHSHTVMTEGPNGEPIQSTGTAFANIGVIVIDEETKTIEDNFLRQVSHSEGEETVYDISADPAVSGYAQEIMDRVNGEYNIVFAESLVDLNGERDPGNRTEETNLGDLITDSMMWTVLKDEGSLSVAAGFSLATADIVFCVIGDLSFFYDQNALWNTNLDGNLRIILLNNSCGGIFYSLKGLHDSPAFEQFVAGAHATDAKGICIQNNVGYFAANDMDSLRSGINWIMTSKAERPMLLEVFTDAKQDNEAIKELTYKIQQQWHKENGKR